MSEKEIGRTRGMWGLRHYLLAGSVVASLAAVATVTAQWGRRRR